MVLALVLGCGEPTDGSGARRDVSHTPEDSGETADIPSLVSAEDILSALAADRTRAMEDVARDHGWPVQTEEGWLFAYSARGDWSVAGDFDGWAGEAMDCADGLCTLLVDEASGGYKFTDGSSWNADGWSRRYLYDENGELSLVSTDAAHLERHFGVGDDANVERTVRVWVPRGEATHLLYAEDGQNLWDPESMWGGWRLDESTPSGMMIVGIDNTADRMEEYTHVVDHIDGDRYGGAGDAYADFVEKTVRPLIRETYGEPEVLGLLGSSLGGLISLHIANRYPGEFAFAASMSGTLGWGSIEDQNETMIQRYAAAGHQSTAIYLDSGGGGDDCRDSDGDGTNDDDPTAEDNYCETIQMRDTLSEEGYAFEEDLWHWHEPGATHDEVSWSERVFRPLEIFAGL
jgi:predicted alpha/beta superfamily hydrolase